MTDPGSRTPARLTILIGGLIGLAACATPADSGRMAVTGTNVLTAFPVAFQHTMCIRAVAGGESTNPLWVSKVDTKDFQTALSASMESAGLLAGPGGCKFPLDVSLLGLSQPGFGLDMEVTSHVNYKVFDSAGQPVLLETISAPFTATFGDSPIGFVRVKRANEGSIRASISQFLNKLTTAAPT
jgi:hypothetical protein